MATETEKETYWEGKQRRCGERLGWRRRGTLRQTQLGRGRGRQRGEQIGEGRRRRRRSQQGRGRGRDTLALSIPIKAGILLRRGDKGTLKGVRDRKAELKTHWERRTRQAETGTGTDWQTGPGTYTERVSTAGERGKRRWRRRQLGRGRGRGRGE